MKWSGMEPSDGPICSLNWDSCSNNLNSRDTCTLLPLLFGCQICVSPFFSERWPRSRIVFLFLIHTNSASSGKAAGTNQPTVPPHSWRSGGWLKHDIRCCHVWKAAQCSRRRVRGKWVRRSSEIQPVPSSHVEISLQHQAQPAGQHWQALPRLAPSLSPHMPAYAVRWQTSCLD